MTIRLETNEPALFGELADVIRIFYPTSVKADEGDLYIRHEGGIQEDRWQDRFYALGFEHTYLAPRRAVGELAIKRERKRAAKTGLFLLLRTISGQSPAWGSLTGIRPTRLLYERLEAGDTPAAAALYLREKFFVSEEKAGLLKEIERMQRGLRTVIKTAARCGADIHQQVSAQRNRLNQHLDQHFRRFPACFVAVVSP